MSPGLLRVPRSRIQATSSLKLGCTGSRRGTNLREEILEGLERLRSIFGRDPAINGFHRTNVENLR